MKSLARLTVAALALLLAISSASSTTAGVFNTYTSENDFLANVYPNDWPFGDTPVATNDFNDLTQNSPTANTLNRTAGRYAYDITAAGGFFPQGPTFPKDVYLATSNDDTQITLNNLTLDTTDPVLAFGGKFFATNTSGLVVTHTLTVTVNGGDASITRSISSVADSFFGFVIADFSSSISSVEVNIASTPNVYATANSVTFAVPEPSTYALLGLALTTGGLCRIRRRLFGKKAA